MPARAHDESLNSYGYWIKTDGIRMDRYSGLFLFNHTRAYRDTTDVILPIGKITSLEKKGSEILMEPEFDESDDFALRLKKKYEAGYINAFSIGVIPLKFSEDAADMKPGQTRATVTECELVEISLVEIPANRNAVKLYERNEQGELVTLSETTLPVVPPAISQNQTDMNLTEVTAALDLSETAQPAAILAEISRLKSEAAKVVALQARIADLEKVQADARKVQVEAMLSDAVSAGKITEAQRPHFAALAESNLESTKAILDGMTPIQTLHQFAATGAAASDGKALHKGKTFAQLSKEDPAELERLKENNFPMFSQLYKSEYGKEYKPTVR